MAEQIGIDDGWLRNAVYKNYDSFDDFKRGQMYIADFKSYTNYPSELSGNHCYFFSFGYNNQYVQMVYGLSDTKLAIRRYDKGGSTEWSEWKYYFGYSTLDELAAALKPKLGL